jgi:hypothetical protein
VELDCLEGVADDRDETSSRLDDRSKIARLHRGSRHQLAAHAQRRGSRNNKTAAVVRFTPLVGIIVICGKGNVGRGL